MALPTVASILLLTCFSTVLAQKDNGEECSCFRTNSSTAYFTNHIFRDFRNIEGASAPIPTILADEDDSTAAGATSDYFLSNEWNSVWTTENWNNSGSFEQNSASVFMINSLNNVYIETSQDSEDPSYSTFLTMRTSRLPSFQTAAEINSVVQNYQYLSMRFLARVTGSPGACAGIFTYLDPSAGNDPSVVQEADIEILTSGPREVVQYTNQPADSQDGDPLADATRNSTNPRNRNWSDWNIYRYDWTPGESRWYVNGETVANISFQAPRDPTQLMLNMWSDGSLWTGNMSLYDEAYLQIQWMQVVYNMSEPTVPDPEDRKRDNHGSNGILKRSNNEDKACAVVCSVDEQVEEPGQVKELYNNTGMAPLGWKGEGMGAMCWLPMGLIGAVLFGYL